MYRYIPVSISQNLHISSIYIPCFLRNWILYSCSINARHTNK